jgi:hypothetical protein
MAILLTLRTREPRIYGASTEDGSMTGVAPTPGFS